MKLNADMVFDSLPHDLLPSMAGAKEQALLLHRPKLLESGDKELMTNHLYVLTRERLPFGPWQPRLLPPARRRNPFVLLLHSGLRN